MTDFIDRHGYFGCHNKGEAPEWSIRDGHTYADRSALRFDPEEPGKPRVFVHPAMDPSYDGKPSMISETTWNRPNRYRSEAPLYSTPPMAPSGQRRDRPLRARHGVVVGEAGLLHAAVDVDVAGDDGPVSGRRLDLPQGAGRAPGDLLVDLNLKLGDLFDLQGTPMPAGRRTSTNSASRTCRRERP